MDYSTRVDLQEGICFWSSILLALVLLAISLLIGARSLIGKATIRSFFRGLLAVPLCWILTLAGQNFVLQFVPSTRYYGFNALLGLVLGAETMLFALALAGYVILFPITAFVKSARSRP